MRTIQILMLAGIAAALLGGCDKKVKLTFVNHTAQSREVQLSGPGVDRSYVGVAAGMGGKARYGTLKVKKDYLPATYEWWAGDVSSRFTVTEDTPGEVWIDIKPSGSGGLRDKHTEVEETKKLQIEDMPIWQDTVVE